MEEEIQTDNVHCATFRERKRLSNKSSETLPQCIIPALYMSCFTCFLASLSQLIFAEALPDRLAKNLKTSVLLERLLEENPRAFDRYLYFCLQLLWQRPVVSCDRVQSISRLCATFLGRMTRVHLILVVWPLHHGRLVQSMVTA